MKGIRSGALPAWVPLLAGFVAFGVRVGTRPLDDNSFLTHLATGRLILDRGVPSTDPYSFSAEGHDWVVQSWLASALYGAVEAVGGGYGLLALNAVLVAGLAALVHALVDATPSLLARLALGGVALGVGAGSWSERPLLVALVLLAATMLVAQCRLPMWSVVPMFALWVNLHGSFPLGVLLLGVLALGARLDGEGGWHELRAAGFGVLGTVAGALLALRPSLLVFPLELLGRSEVLERVVEWRAPAFTSGWQRLFLLQLLVAVALLVRRPRWRSALPLVVFGGLALLALRNIPVASLVLLPGMAAAVGAPGSLRVTDRTRMAAVATLASVLAVVALTVSASSEPPFALGGYPVEHLALIEAGDLSSRRVATPDVVGNLLEAIKGEDAEVFYDDRFDMFPTEISRDYRVLLDGGPGWARVLDRHEIEVVVWPDPQPLAQLLSQSPEWQVVVAGQGWVTATRRAA